MTEYSKGRKDSEQTISRRFVDIVGVDNSLYAITHALAVECIEKGIPHETRRSVILERVNKILDSWVE